MEKVNNPGYHYLIKSLESNSDYRIPKSRTGSIIKTSSFVPYADPINSQPMLMEQRPSLINSRKYSVIDPDTTRISIDSGEFAKSF